MKLILNINYKTLFYLIILGIIIWLVYAQIEIFTPFVLALIFAYVFNPLINFFYTRLHFPRAVSILLVYVLLILSVVFTLFFTTSFLFHESSDIQNNFVSFASGLKSDVKILPSWMQPYVRGYIDYFRTESFFAPSHVQPFPFFTRAFSGFINIFAFLFAAFFFLKDYKKMIDHLVSFAPKKYHHDINTLVRQINHALSSYLRGQIIIIVTMAIMLMIMFTVLGIHYALTISVISALFEIVPIIGPIAAGIFGVITVIISGGIQHLEVSPLATMLIVVAVYYISRQLQDYLIIPYVYARATRLHPLIILFSVLAAEHIYGILGVLLAVPVAASIKITYEYISEKLHEDESLAPQ